MTMDTSSPNTPSPEQRGPIMPSREAVAPGVEHAPLPSPAAEAAAGPSQGAPVSPPLTASDVSAAIAGMPVPSAPGSAAPSTASDEDLIEPEWVDKTEEVI